MTRPAIAPKIAPTIARMAPIIAPGIAPMRAPIMPRAITPTMRPIRAPAKKLGIPRMINKKTAPMIAPTMANGIPIKAAPPIATIAVIAKATINIIAMVGMAGRRGKNQISHVNPETQENREPTKEGIAGAQIEGKLMQIVPSHEGKKVSIEVGKETVFIREVIIFIMKATAPITMKPIPAKIPMIATINPAAKARIPNVRKFNTYRITTAIASTNSKSAITRIGPARRISMTNTARIIMKDITAIPETPKV